MVKKQNLPNDPPDESSLTDYVQRREARKIRVRNEQDRTMWSGFRAFGAVGWSIVVPTVGGAFLGMWLDRRFPSDFSWTLAFLLAGLSAGCILAWNWIQGERNEIDSEQ